MNNKFSTNIAQKSTTTPGNRFAGGCKTGSGKSRPGIEDIEFVKSIKWDPEKQEITVVNNNHTDLIIDLSKSIDPTITRDIKVRVWAPDLQSYTLKTIVDSGTTYTEALQTITACIGNGDSETFQKNVTKIAEDVFDEKNVWKVWEN